jgi:DMSO/TMAO reductase YedYZ molybdopterin-dependent catalytic subunit
MDMSQTSPVSVPPGKSADLVPLPGDDLNFGTALPRVSERLVPTELFFVRSSYPPPSIAPADWRMRVDGLVGQPQTLDLAALRRLPTVDQECWLECAGNSRSRYVPPAEGNQWGHHAVGDAVFTGVVVRDVLELAGGLRSEVVDVVFTGGDDARFQRALPRAVALQPDVLLAWAMNGQPLPAANGGPVRLIVPRWAGVASVKWPVHVEAVGDAFTGHYQTERYMMYDTARQPLRPVREMPVKSVIAWPEAGARLALAEPTTVFGFAWSGFGGIASVEFSHDAGQTWRAADLQPPPSALVWIRWQTSWTPGTSGRARLAVRARDSAGNTQPTSVPHNHYGYEMNAVEIIDVEVEAGGMA